MKARRPALARMTLGLGAVLVAATLVRALPRETPVELDLGPRHAEVVELRVDYTRQGEPLSGARFAFPRGAPPRVEQRVNASPGMLEARIELRAREGPVRRLTRRFEVPAEGTVRLSLAGEAP